MPVDTSIYNNIQPVQIRDPLEQYSKLAQLQALQGQTRLQGLQGQVAEQSIADTAAERAAAISAGGDISKYPAALLAAGRGGPAIAAESARIKAQQEQAGTEHTRATTADLKAGALATSIANIIRDPSDTGVKTAFENYTRQGYEIDPRMVDAMQNATPEQRRQLAISTAIGHPKGALVLKELFPESSTSTVGMGPSGSQVTTTTKTRPGFNAPTRTTAAAPVADASGPAGEDFLKTIPKNIGDQVKALVEGRMQFPGGMALKTPYWQNMLTMVSQYDPNFDQVNYNARAATRKAFTSGTEAKSLNALNTVMGHLDEFDKSAAALNNTGFTLWNQAVNTLGSKVDPDLKARLNRFDLTKQAVVDEMEKAYRGSGGSQAGIDAWKKTVDNADSYKALQASMQQGVKLLESKIDALGDQYSKGMGVSSSGLQLLNPKARATFERLSGGGRAQPGGGNVNAAPMQVAPHVQKLLDMYAPAPGAARG